MQIRPSLPILLCIVMPVLRGAVNELTPCDFNAAFDGKQAAVRAAVGFTMHGAYLLPEGCKGKGQSAALLFPNERGAPKVDFQLDAHAVDQLRPFFRTTGGSSKACGLFVGQIAYKRRFRLKQEGGGPQGNGYGSRGTSRFALILRSVSEVRSCECRSGPELQL
jgi:hypothetical protein